MHALSGKGCCGSCYGQRHLLTVGAGWSKTTCIMTLQHGQSSSQDVAVSALVASGVTFVGGASCLAIVGDSTPPLPSE